MKHRIVRPVAFACATMLGLAVGGLAMAQKTAAVAKPSKAQLAAELAATLQACSYDGSPLAFSPPDLSKGGGTGKQVVAEIMKYTGLPANFVVVEGKVPNAAAVIMQGPDKVPRRVIAYNPAFMGEVIQATKSNNWAPVSIMAHEIGHHLSGHTIVPGGSQPPIELESDKFSGFVLYKMGAPLADAQRAIATLIPEKDGETHPGRKKRLAAIANGWTEACELQGGGPQCSGGLPVRTAAAAPAAPAPAAASPAPAPATTVAKAPAPTAAPAVPSAKTPAPALAAAAETLPKVDAAAIPSKGTQFIYDEFGILDPAIRAQFEKQMYDHAQKTGVEIVTLLVKDLGGKTAEEYAHAMMRQLRVGKLDVGNGAVLVVAPEQNQAAAVLGSGVALEMGSHDKTEQLKRWMNTAWALCKKKSACGNWTENLMLAADHLRRDTSHADWTIAYQSLGDIQKADAAENGKVTNPKDSKVWRKIVRLSGTVESLNPPTGNKAAWVNDIKVKNGKQAVLLRSAEGFTAMLYVDPRTAALQPGGKLEQGRVYTVIARADWISGNPQHTQSLDVLSYAVTE
ncbi:TLP18.3/Psb32/MOLO-1 phosphatase superfamily protein [Acidovorax sp. 93]|uniref:TPM domain-containing protein n=1 Tax=Acidovorax sp. 93 TaxID=2135632 RepID=UPI000EB5ED98|nr:TPM domain-containing protein [Acidovorax sp. 93]RKR24949.1 TLP18.3/Psb32/MOLO-1 phosphatase superfamily protein [Acidovorax sp. 93]